MIYNDNFWVVAGTAAPVIALAAVVALPGTVSLQFEAAERSRSAKAGGPKERFPRWWGLWHSCWNEQDAREFLKKFAFWNYILTVSNVIIQAALLAVSLSALAVRRNVIPQWIAIVLAAGGILGLAQTVVWSVVIQSNSRHVDEKFRAHRRAAD